MDSPISMATGGSEAAAESSRTPYCAAPAPALPPLRPNSTFETSDVADKLVARDIVETISPECVRTTLKKTRSNQGSTNSG